MLKTEQHLSESKGESWAAHKQILTTVHVLQIAS